MRLQRQNSGLEQSNDQTAKGRQLKGNQELNEELETKANELEKLFAAHQLRFSSNQAVSSRRISPVDVTVEEVKFVQRPEKILEKPPTGSVPELNPNMNIVELGQLNSSKGRLYDRYMKIRDAKLRQEWGPRRVENDEMMKAIGESLERIRTVMKATSAGCSHQQELARPAQTRAEKWTSLRCSRTAFVTDSCTQSKPVEPIQIQDDCVSDSSQKSLENGSTRSSRSNKLMHSKTFSSPIPRSSAPPIPRSSSKGSSIGRRRILPENPVENSLPNFSQLKEENIKHSQGIRKETSHLQSSHVPHSKSTNGHISSTKKDSVRRSQSLKKSSVSPNDLKDTSNPYSSGVNSRLFQKNIESKPFLKKGNGIGPGEGASAAKLKAAVESESMSSGEESVRIVDKLENPESVVHETQTTIGIPGSDGIVIVKFIPQGEPDMVPPTFHTPVRPVQDSPAQTPASWTSQMNSPFSYSHNRPDIDFSGESPRASPASLSSQSLTNLETNLPRIRKKWGIAQKPFVSTNASDHQPNNMAKGFKRLLNFGRKSRGTADCISTTTAEADDDTEEVCYLASRSSDDLGKSGMGFSHSPSSYGSFNDEGEFVGTEVQTFHSSIPAPPENFKVKDHQLSGSLLTAPKSFFSLPSFRKGSDLKIR